MQQNNRTAAASEAGKVVAQYEESHRNLYVYDLPELLVTSLVPVDDNSTTTATTTTGATSPPPPDSLSTDTTAEDPYNPTSTHVSTNCTLCNVQNRTVADQRTHARSDLHKFNLKRRVRGQKPVTEAEFEKMLADIDETESISGSDEEEDGGGKGGGLSGLSEEEDEVEETGSGAGDVARRKRGVNPSSVGRKYNPTTSGSLTDDEELSKGVPKSPILWFSSPNLPDNVAMGIYRVLFPLNSPTNQLQPFLEKVQIKRPTKSTIGPHPTSPHVFLCMIGGGHFAAMVISLPPVYGNHRSGERTAHVVAHQSFHRYTTRRKQGGSQSANDAHKGKANSAGAQIRRYNEAELQREIRELLASWKDKYIDTAELLFVRAAGTGNKRTLFYYDDAVLRLKDERLRGFPFSTRRATQSELMRSFMELTRVKFASLEDVAGGKVGAGAEAVEGKTSTTTEAVKPVKSVKPTKEERERLEHTTSLVGLVKRNKIPQLATYVSANGLSPDFEFFPAEAHTHAPTALHLAASLGHAAMVTALLMKLGANPAVRGGGDSGAGKAPFEVAGDRATRDAFRLARGELGEARWDWDGAGVGAAVTREEVERRAGEREAERKREEGRERERREKEAERLRKEEAAAGKKGAAGAGARKGVMLGVTGGGSGGTLGGGGSRLRTGEDLGVEREIAQMTPEARMRLERERRARAAEERMRRLQLQ